MERKEYDMKCPKCGYKYKLSLLRDCGVEHCPICGYFAMFESFMTVKEPSK